MLDSRISTNKFLKKTCSLTDTPFPNKNGTLFAGCDNYRLADYQFITSYCYARMYGFELGMKKVCLLRILKNEKIRQFNYLTLIFTRILGQ